MPSNSYTDYTLLLAHRACSLYCRLSHYVSRVYLPYLPLGSNPRKTKTIISKHLEESLLCRKKVLTQCLLAEKREERNIGRNVSGYNWNSSQPFTGHAIIAGVIVCFLNILDWSLPSAFHALNSWHPQILSSKLFNPVSSSFSFALSLP